MKENKFLLILAAVFIVFGIACPFMPLLHNVDYSALNEKEAVVESFDRVKTLYSYHYELTTDDGEHYIVSTYNSEIGNVPEKGQSVTVKWYEVKLFFSKYVAEITCDGEEILPYHKFQLRYWQGFYAAGGLFVLFGVMLLVLCWLLVRHNRKIQQARNRRIIKKYGSIRQ